MTASFSSPMKAAGARVARPSAAQRLEKLFRGLYGGTRDDLPVPSDAQLAEVLAASDPYRQNLLEQAGRRLPELAPDGLQRGVLDQAPRILSEYFSQPMFHPALGEALLAASGPLVAAALPADGWLTRRRHPVGALLAIIAEVATGWDPGHARFGEIRERLCEWLARSSENETLHQTVAEARDWLADFHRRRERVLERVGQAERGALRLRQARRLAARSLNAQVAGRALPDFMASSLQREWLEVLQWILLHEGEDSRLHQQFNRCFGLLVWSLQPEAVRQPEKLEKVAGRVRGELREVLTVALGDETQREELLEAVQVALFCQTRGRELDYVDPPSVEGGDALDAAGATVSEDILREVARVRQGDWFEEVSSGQRVQLLLRDDASRQLLFVNQPGMRALVCSFEEFAWRFTSAEMSAVPEVVPLEEWVSSRLEWLVQQYRERREVLRERRARARAEQLEREQAREESRRRALEEARRAEQAMHEHEQALQQQEEASRERTARSRHRARLLVSGLTMGSWLSFSGQGQQYSRRLAVVLPSSGKYIFVDTTGAEKHQVSREELVEGLMDGSITLLEQDGRFDNALDRLTESARPREQ